MATALEQFLSLAEQLSLEEKKRVIEFLQELIKAETGDVGLPPGTPGSALLNVHFSMSYEEAESMKRAIMEDRERV